MDQIILFYYAAFISDKLLRAFVVFVFLLVCVRILRKHELGQLTMADFVGVLIISNAVQNSIIGNDTSLVGGIISAAAIFSFIYAFDKLIVHRPKLRDILQGHETTLIRDGKILHNALEKEGMNDDDLYAQMRKHGIDKNEIHRVKKAVLEADGDVSVILHDHRQG